MSSKSDYNSHLGINDVKGRSPVEVGSDYEESTCDWYHLLLNEDDFCLLIAIPNIKWYAICRCHLVTDDGSTAHEHMHALIHFVNGSTHLGLKKKLQRAGKRLSSKTTFRKIICLDHAVGVLRYICCRDGQRPTRRDGDGLLGKAHVHYSRRVFNCDWLHERGRECCNIRDDISYLVSEGVKEMNKYTSKTELHKKETCLCDRGDIGIKRRQEANRRRKEFYKTEKGLAVRKLYREKQEKKRQLIKKISELGINKKADLYRETIVKLLELL